MGDFVGDRQCVTHHACECIMARAKAAEQLEAERDALKEGLLELLDALYRSDIDWEGCLHGYRNARKAALAASVSKEEARDAP